MATVCGGCEHEIPVDGEPCPVCGGAVAGPVFRNGLVAFGLREMQKYSLPFCHLIAGITLAVFLYLSF